MRKIIICFCLALAAFALPVTLAAQSGTVETDIFGDLRFRSSRDGYSAALKKDIFDNLTFTDSRRNEIIFDQEYLAEEYPAVLDSEEARRDFFRSIVSRHRGDEGYRAKYSVDILGTVVTEDNRGNRTEEKTDIFGNKSYEETRNGRRMSIRRDLHGDLQYSSGSRSASLGKTFNAGKWVYRDSGGNRFEFGEATWNEMIRRHGNDERIFLFLIDDLLRD